LEYDKLPAREWTVPKCVAQRTNLLSARVERQSQTEGFLPRGALSTLSAFDDSRRRRFLRRHGFQGADVTRRPGNSFALLSHVISCSKKAAAYTFKRKAPHTEVVGLSFWRRYCCRALKFKELLSIATIFEWPHVVFACRLRLIVLRLGWAQNNLTVDGEGLQNNVEAFAVLVHERGADVKPKVVLALSLDDGVRLLGRLLSRHGDLLSVGWVSARPRT
jgi:hypothetical protein